MALELSRNTPLALPSDSTFIYSVWAPYRFHSSYIRYEYDTIRDAAVAMLVKRYSESAR